MRSFLAFHWARHPATLLAWAAQLGGTVLATALYWAGVIPVAGYFAVMWLAALAGGLLGSVYWDRIIRAQNPLLPCRRCGTKPSIARLEVHTEEGTQTFRVVALDQQPDLCPECYERAGMRELVKNKKRAIRARFSAAEAVRRFGRKR